jgi:putative ABC transport system permease protein
MRSLLDDLRLAVRALARSPGFTTVVVLTLGVSIGATTAVYSVVDGVLLRPLPFDQPEQLVRPTWDRTVRAGWPFNSMGLTLLEQRSRSYSSFGVHGALPASVTVMAQGEPEQVQLVAVDAGFWSTLGVTPVLGRVFTPEEDVPGGAILAVLSEAFWVEQFGGDPSAIGSTLELNGFSVEIIGVAPASLQYPFPGLDMYVSARIDRTSRNINHGWYVVARLREGTTRAEADRELESLVPSLPEVGYPPEFARLFTGTGSVPTLRDHLVGPVRRPLLTLLIVTGFVLLIGCVNVANLLLVRGSQRLGQGAVRRALGATPGQMARYVLSESVVLALAGGLLGMVVAWLGVRGLLALQPASIPRLDLVKTLSPSVLLYSSGVALATALLAGAVPAVRMGSVRAMGVVRGGATAQGGRGARRLNHVLVVTETALALMVLVGSVLLVRSASAVRDVDKGFDSENRLVFRTSALVAGFSDPGDVARHHADVLRALREMPGVEASGAVTAVPLTPGGLVQQLISPVQDFESPEGESISRKIRAASPGYFEAMGMPLLSGRNFEAADHLESAAVTIVSESMAEEFWPGRNPLGLTIMDSIRVVGVVGDVTDVRVTDEEPPIAYFPLLSAAWGAGLSYQMHYVVRTSGDPMQLVPTIRDELRRIAPGVPMYEFATMDRIVADSIDTFTFAGRMMVLAAAIALFLGAVGMYAVLAYSVRVRRGEIGLRMALGASGREAGRLIVRDGLSLAAAGIVLGLVGAVAAARVMAAMLFGVTPFDVPTYASAVVIFTAVAIGACLVPAARAAAVPPAVALRGE